MTASTNLRTIITVGIAALLFGVSIHVSRHKEKVFGHQSAAEVYVSLPLDYLRVAAFSHDEAAADMQWVRFVQAVPNRPVGEAEGIWMANVVTSVVHLDPEFYGVYERGATILGVMGLRPKEALHVAELGIVRKPDSHRLPLVAAYMCFYEMQDFACGAEYMELVTSLPDHPQWAKGLTARLKLESGDPDAAIEDLKRWADRAEDPETKREFLKKAARAQLAKHFGILETAMAAYTEQSGQAPTSLDDMVKAGVLDSIPEEPFGGLYRLVDGKLETTSGETPLKLHFAPDTGPVQ